MVTCVHPCAVKARASPSLPSPRSFGFSGDNVLSRLSWFGVDGYFFHGYHGLGLTVIKAYGLGFRVWGLGLRYPSPKCSVSWSRVLRFVVTKKSACIGDIRENAEGMAVEVS